MASSLCSSSTCLTCERRLSSTTAGCSALTPPPARLLALRQTSKQQARLKQVSALLAGVQAPQRSPMVATGLNNLVPFSPTDSPVDGRVVQVTAPSKHE